MMGTPEKMLPFVLFMCIDVNRCAKMFQDAQRYSIIFLKAFLLALKSALKAKTYHNSLLCPHHKSRNSV